LKKLNNKEIDQYLKKTGTQILASTGCYQAEKLGPQIIKSIKGDLFNVLGFPLFPFLSFLSKRYK
jgi:septum formation protein